MYHTHFLSAAAIWRAYFAGKISMTQRDKELAVLRELLRIAQS